MLTHGELAPQEFLRPRTDTSPHEHSILVAEDDPELRKTISIRLRERGYSVAEADSSMAFLDCLSDLVIDAAPAERPALVIADVRMPGLSTFRILDVMTRVRGGPALVCVSSHPTEDARLSARRVGALGLYELPAELEKVISLCSVIVPLPHHKKSI